MVTKVSALIGTVPYLTTISSEGKTIIGDEPLDKGGQDKGFNPFELLASSLASCTCATLRMYIDRKQWPVSEIETQVVLEREGERTRFERIISFKGTITEEQRQKLSAIANACPVHKMLSGTIEISTTL